MGQTARCDATVHSGVWMLNDMGEGYLYTVNVNSRASVVQNPKGHGRVFYGTVGPA